MCETGRRRAGHSFEQSNGNIELSPAAEEEARKVLARVGRPAPDFEVNAYVDGGFKNVKLSDYKGKWVVLCFYPGDFTFV